MAGQVVRLALVGLLAQSFLAGALPAVQNDLPHEKRQVVYATTASSTLDSSSSPSKSSSPPSSSPSLPAIPSTTISHSSSPETSSGPWSSTSDSTSNPAITSSSPPTSTSSSSSSSSSSLTSSTTTTSSQSATFSTITSASSTTSSSLAIPSTTAISVCSWACSDPSTTDSNACKPLPTGSAPATLTPADDDDSFKHNPVYADFATKATTPEGYDQVFQKLNHIPVGVPVIWASSITSYSPSECSTYCTQRENCFGFNLYIQRDPTVIPGPTCPNPSSTATYMCMLFGDSFGEEQATNHGQWWDNFHVVIAASNGYVKKLQPQANADVLSADGQSSLVKREELVRIPDAMPERDAGFPLTVLTLEDDLADIPEQTKSFRPPGVPIPPKGFPNTTSKSSPTKSKTKHTASKPTKIASRQVNADPVLPGHIKIPTLTPKYKTTNATTTAAQKAKPTKEPGIPFPNANPFVTPAKKATPTKAPKAQGKNKDVQEGKFEVDAEGPTIICIGEGCSSIIRFTIPSPESTTSSLPATTAVEKRADQAPTPTSPAKLISALPSASASKSKSKSKSKKHILDFFRRETAQADFSVVPATQTSSSSDSDSGSAAQTPTLSKRVEDNSTMTSPPSVPTSSDLSEPLNQNRVSLITLTKPIEEMLSTMALEDILNPKPTSTTTLSEPIEEAEEEDATSSSAPVSPTTTIEPEPEVTLM